MGRLQSVIDEFEKLDLETCSIEDVQALLLEVGKVPATVQGLHEGSVIYRARILKGNEEITSVKDLSYNPIVDRSFQRASVPNEIMFYGVSELSDSTNGEMLAIQEVCPFFKKDEPIEDGTYRIAVSQWHVCNTLKLIVLINPEMTNKSERMNEMVDNLHQFIQEHTDKWDREDAIGFQKFMCGQFTKRVRENDNDQYKISASFAQTVIDEGLHGVIWESSWVNDEQLRETLCVAIKPEVVDTFMQCERYQLYTFTFKDNKQVSCEQKIFSSTDFSTPVLSTENEYPIQTIITTPIVTQLGANNEAKSSISASDTSHNLATKPMLVRNVKKKKRKTRRKKRKENITLKRGNVGKSFIKKRRVRGRNRRKRKEMQLPNKLFH
jgi:hypothetical protein